jgi:hypothetical protein
MRKLFILATEKNIQEVEASTEYTEQEKKNIIAGYRILDEQAKMKHERQERTQLRQRAKILRRRCGKLKVKLEKTEKEFNSLFFNDDLFPYGERTRLLRKWQESEEG